MNVKNQLIVIMGSALLLGVSSTLAALPNDTYAQLHTTSNSGFYTFSNPTRLSQYRSGVWLSGDFNGDGRDDLISIYGGQARVIEGAFYQELLTSISFANETGFEATPRRRSLGVTGGNAAHRYRWLVGDFNGDGKDDLAFIRTVGEFNDGVRARAGVLLSNETGFTLPGIETKLSRICEKPAMDGW